MIRNPRVPSKRWPLGAMGALGLLVACELGLRIANPTGTLPWAYKERSYRALMPELDAFGARPVAIVGNSRAREAVVGPLLSDLVEAQVGARAVANYSMSGAHAEEGEVVITRLLEAVPAPRVVVWVISPRELVRRRKPSPKPAYIWRLSDWWSHPERFEERMLDALPSIVMNELARFSLIVRYRPEVRRLLFDRGEESLIGGLDTLLHPDPGTRSPLRGGLAPWQASRGRNRSKAVTEERVRKYVRNRYEGKRWPSPFQIDRLEAAVERCAAAGVPVFLVEVPLHPALHVAMGPKIVPEFGRVMARLAESPGVFHLPVDALGTRFTPRDFREQSHLNYRGAQKFTRAIAPVIGRTLAP